MPATSGSSSASSASSRSQTTSAPRAAKASARPHPRRHSRDDQHGLRAQEAGFGRSRAPRGELGERALPQLAVDDRILVAAARSLGGGLQAPLGTVEVGQHQLCLDRREDRRAGRGSRADARPADARRYARRARSRPRRGCGRGSGCPTPPLVSAAHEPRDVHDLEMLGDTASDPQQVPHLLESRVRHRHDGDIRLDCREGVFGGLRTGMPERVEQRRLARVGKAHDADLHEAAASRVSPTKVPSTAPATTSEG